MAKKARRRTTAQRTGHCDCGQLRYSAEDDPIIVHCCHCRACQRQTGSAFAVNFLVEAVKVDWEGRFEHQQAETPSGHGQLLVRCPDCHTTVSSHYDMGPGVHFLRVGTMDDPSGIEPDVHIYMSTKQQWVLLDPATPAFEEMYDPKDFWSERTMARVRAAMGR